MALLAYDLRGDVVGRSALGVSSLVKVIQLHRQSEVPNLDLVTFAQKYVGELDVSVNDFAAVNFLNAQNNLNQEVPYFGVVQAFSIFQNLVQIPILAIFKQNINILLIFKDVLELHDVLMLQFPMNLDFLLQFFFGALVFQIAFADYLSSVGAPRFPAL